MLKFQLFAVVLSLFSLAFSLFALIINKKVEFKYADPERKKKLGRLIKRLMVTCGLVAASMIGCLIFMIVTW